MRNNRAERSLVVAAFGIAHASHEVPHLVEVSLGLHRAALAQAPLPGVSSQEVSTCAEQMAEH